MDGRLSQLIADYQRAANVALSLLEQSGVERPKNCVEWSLRSCPQRGALEGGVTYFKHGFGCEFIFPDFVLDFDFDAEGQIAKPDSWRLHKFAKMRLADYGFDSRQELENAHQIAVARKLTRVV